MKTSRVPKLDKFLELYRVKSAKKIKEENVSILKDNNIQKEENVIITHTSFGKKVGSFSIPEDKRSELYDLIIDSVYSKKEPVPLVERPLFTDGMCIKPLVIDIDFRFSFDYPKRQYKVPHVQEIVNLYNTVIRKYINLPNNYDLKSYVFERDGPYKDNGNFKDGIHIIYPELYSSTKVQFLIRKDVIAGFDSVINNNSIGQLPVKNDYNDIVDRSVIEQNGWFLYGCSKMGLDRYELTHIYLHKYLHEIDDYKLIEDKNFELRQLQNDRTVS